MSRTPRILLVLVAMVAVLLPVGAGGTAYATASCPTLHAADVAYGAPLLTAHLDDASPTACFDLDLPQGTSILIGERSGTADIRLFSGTSEVSCAPDQPCQLTNPGPQRITVDRNGRSEASLDLRVLALTAESGCPEVSETDLGAPDAPFSLDLRGDDVTCRTIHREAGLHLLNQGAGQDLSTALVAPDGTSSCFVRGTGGCRTSADATYVLGLADTSRAPFDNSYTLQSVDLDHVASCPEISSSWESAPSDVSISSVDVACRTIANATSGERFAVATGSAGHGDTGQWTLTGSHCDAGPSLGCTVEGDGPFRVVTWGSSSYQVVARQVGPGSDCPTAPVLALGSRPDDDHPGVGCRVVPVPAGHPFVAASVDPTTGDFAYRTQIFDGSYSRTCYGTPEPDAQFDTCTVDPPGGITVITDPFGADVHTFVYDLSSTNGCTTPPHLRRTHQTDLVPFELACENVDQDAGTVVTTYQRAGQTVDTTRDYVDADDNNACDPIGDYLVGSCRLIGTAPFRLLLHATTPHLHTTTLSADDLAGCPTVLGEGTSRAAEVTLSTATSFRCLRIASVRSGTTELVHAYRDGITGPLTVGLLGQDGIEIRRSHVDSGPLDLTLGRPDGSATVAVLGTPGAVTVARAAVNDEHPIVNWRRPQILGGARVGRAVMPGYGQWSSAAGTIHPGVFTWLLDGAVVSHLGRYTPPSSAAGKRLVLRVTVYASDSDASRTADSAATTVATR